MEDQYSPPTSSPHPENVPINNKGFIQNLEKKIEDVLGKIDNGNIFKTIIDFVFKAFSYIFLIFGTLSCVINIFGDDGYFSRFDYLDGIHKFTAVVGFLLGLVVCLLVIYIVFRIISNRSQQLKSKTYDGILNYIFIKTVPVLLVTFGEILSLLILTVGLLFVFANLLGSMVYFPLSDLSNTLSDILDLGIASGNTQIFLPGNWDYFSEGMKMSVGIMIVSPIILIAVYVAREVYFYVYKLVVNLIKFLPKFAIPLAIRKRNE